MPTGSCTRPHHRPRHKSSHLEPGTPGSRRRACTKARTLRIRWTGSPPFRRLVSIKPTGGFPRSVRRMGGLCLRKLGHWAASKHINKPASISTAKKPLHINNLAEAKCELLCSNEGKVRTSVVDNQAKCELLCEARCELLWATVRTSVQGANFCAARPKCLVGKAFGQLSTQRCDLLCFPPADAGESVSGELAVCLFTRSAAGGVRIVGKVIKEVDRFAPCH